MRKVITLDGTKYLLPENMPTKDVQALAGFLVTLTKVESFYQWGEGDYLHYSDRGAEVRIEDLELLAKAEAKALSDKSRADYEAQRAQREATA